MSFVFQFLSPKLDPQFDSHFYPSEGLPVLGAGLEETLFRVWRRWDAVHYLTLAVNGYTGEGEESSIFPPLTPLSFWVGDQVLPGGIDAAAMVVSTLVFAIFLTLLYRVCENYYADEKLAKAALGVMCVLPTAYVFSAPMSEGWFLLGVMGFWLMAGQGRWGWATACGLLATLARQQGVILCLVAVFLLWEQSPTLSWWATLRRLWLLVTLPAAWVGFLAYRTWLGLPPYQTTQSTHYGTFFTDPLSGFWSILQSMWAKGSGILLDADLLMVIVCLGLLLYLLRVSPQRPAVLVYTVLSLLLFFTLGFEDADGKRSKVSFARQSLALFPLWVLLAQTLYQASKPVRLGYSAFSLFSFLFLSAAHALGSGVS